MIGATEATLTQDGRVRTRLVSRNADRNLKAHFNANGKSFGSYLFLMLIVLVALIIAMLWVVALLIRQRDRKEALRTGAQRALEDYDSASDREHDKKVEQLNENEEARRLRKRRITYVMEEVPHIDLQDLIDPFA
ncbi:hypothetical protein Tcan_12418 [Toxocara canis]|uniref:Uncharacterized protein n=2 Tax=Toxocara canis TaxID=6265 RepID=A0A0B2VI53_TOXCA|nr:hypothetical protein Tcan_12418 [Toxocara canis]VDM49578.1 unnamed protein product [Toxocara canis]